MSMSERFDFGQDMSLAEVGLPTSVDVTLTPDAGLPFVAVGEDVVLPTPIAVAQGMFGVEIDWDAVRRRRDMVAHQPFAGA